MSGDNQKTEQQHEVKGAAVKTTSGLDQASGTSVPNSLGGYSGIAPNEFALVEAYRRIQRETGGTEVGHYFEPLMTEAQSKAFKEKFVEQRMVPNPSLTQENVKKEALPEDQSVEPKAKANTKNE